MSDRLTEALTAWRDVLGAAHVHDDEAELTVVGQTTFAVGYTVEAVLLPGTTQEVQDCVRIASRFRVALYPVSQGKNWGLGGRVPPRAGCVLLDLRRMNRIVEYHPALSYLVVEPGVTFHQAAAHLRSEGDRHWIAATGASGHGSLIGNALERGDGIGRYGERIYSLAALEVVLPDGDCIRTGFAALTDGPVAHTHPLGVGPSLDGLFAQSGLGIVTRATFHLEAIPANLHVLNAPLPDGAALARCADSFRELVAQGFFQGAAVFFWNQYKVLARDQRFPWQQLAPPLLPDQIADVPWQVSAFLTAPSAVVGAVQCAHVREVAAAADLTLEAHALSEEDIREFLAPHEDNIRTTYWRKGATDEESGDPERDRCGVHWVCLALPLDGERLAAVFERCEVITLAHRFEPHIGAAIMSPRAVNAFVSIMYDRNIAGEDERAQSCHDALLGALLAMGTPPYRLGIQSMPWLAHRETRYAQLHARLKSLFDPLAIVAPGRYDWSTDIGGGAR